MEVCVMKLIEQYIIDVVQYVPTHSRELVEMKIRKDIQTQLYKEGVVDQNEQEIKRVLNNFGEPKRVAKQYLKANRSLIGPTYFPNYIQTLRIAGFSIIISITIVNIVLFAISSVSFIQFFGTYMSMLWQTLIQAFVIITLVFVLLESNNIHLDILSVPKSQRFKIAKNQISRSDAIFSIIFLSVFLLFAFFISQGLFTFYFQDTFIFLLFNHQVFQIYQWLAIMSLLLALIQEFCKVFWGFWTYKRVIINALFAISSAIFAIIFITIPNLFDESLVSALQMYTRFTIQTLIDFLIVIIVVSTLVEIGVSIYKVLSMPENNNTNQK